MCLQRPRPNLPVAWCRLFRLGHPKRPVPSPPQICRRVRIVPLFLDSVYPRPQNLRHTAAHAPAAARSRRTVRRGKPDDGGSLPSNGAVGQLGPVTPRVTCFPDHRLHRLGICADASRASAGRPAWAEKGRKSASFNRDPRAIRKTWGKICFIFIAGRPAPRRSLPHVAATAARRRFGAFLRQWTGASQTVAARQ